MVDDPCPSAWFLDIPVMLVFPYLLYLLSALSTTANTSKKLQQHPSPCFPENLKSK